LPTWAKLLEELLTLEAAYILPVPGQPLTPANMVSPADTLRRRYLAKLSAKTERAIITYYSGFQEHPEAPPRTLQVNSADIAGFMEACSDAPESTLDLFLHSPGGDPDAAEQICGYLRTQFEHIRAVVPVYAMSAATMMALSADEVLMGAHSQLGPIDPQMTITTPTGPRTASAQAIKDQFALALQQCQDPKNLAAWTPILQYYSPGLLAACDHASERANKIVATALEKYMLAGADDPAEAAKAAADWFGDAQQLLSHGRPVRRDEAREHGVDVKDLEADPELQDLVLSVHHTAMLTLTRTGTAKLIESHKGRAWVQQMQQQLIAIQGSPGGPLQPGGPLPPAIQLPKSKAPPQSPRKRNRRGR
jgi:ATP-dependent protease ClpP protease subunit